MKKKFKLEDLDCANCAAKMENAIKKINGVNDANVSFLAQKMTIDAQDDQFDRIMEEAGDEIDAGKDILVLTHGTVLMCLLALKNGLDFATAYLTARVENGQAINVTLPAGQHHAHMQCTFRRRDADISLTSNARLFIQWNRVTGEIEATVSTQ